jgi:hypothetical protein
MSDSPHLYILEHHKFQLLKVLDEGPYHLVALVKNLDGINLELQLYLRTESNADMLERFDKKFKQEHNFKSSFCLNHAAYAKHDKYSILCYRQVDSQALVPQFGFSLHEHKPQDFEAIFSALELIQFELEKESSLTPLIPALRLIRNSQEFSIKVRMPGASPVHQLIISKNDADLLDLCPPVKLSSKEQYFFFRNRLFLYLVCGKSKPVEYRALHPLTPKIQKLFKAIQADPLNCHLTIASIHAEQLRQQKRRKAIKIGLSTFLALFLIAFVFKGKLLNSDWLGDIYDPIELQTRNSPVSPPSPTRSYDESALKNEQQAILNLAVLGFAEKAKKRQQLSRPFYKKDTDFQDFTFELENNLSQNFNSAYQEVKNSMDSEHYDRVESIIQNLNTNYPNHTKKREFENFLVSIPFKKAQRKQNIAKAKVLKEQDLPSLKAIEQEYKNRLLKPLKELKKIHDLAKGYEEKSANANLRHLLKCEQIYSKAEYQLFYDAIKQQNLKSATAFLARHFPQYKTVSKITPYGFDLDDGSQSSYTFFNEKQLADYFVSNIKNSKRKSLNLALYCYKHKLNELFQVFNEEVRDPKDKKILEFILRSVKVRESLMKQSSVEN